MRIASVAYVGVGFVSYLAVGTMTERSFVPIVHLLAPLVAAVLLPLPPAALLYALLLMWGEWKHPQGDVALRMRELQFHLPGQPIVANGEYGTAAFLNAKQSGFTLNPIALATRPQPIVEQVAK